MKFGVIVPRQAVGERCEVMHEVNLLDIELDLGDVMAVDDVIDYFRKLAEPAGADRARRTVT